MKNERDVKKYRKEKTIALIQKYKGLIDETFNIFDENKNEKNSDEKETEQEKLSRIKKRSNALEQVQEFLSEIERLEHHLKESNGKETKNNNTDDDNPTNEEEGAYHPTKTRAKR